MDANSKAAEHIDMILSQNQRILDMNEKLLGYITTTRFEIDIPEIRPAFKDSCPAKCPPGQKCDESCSYWRIKETKPQ